MSRRAAVQVREVKGGRRVCVCHGWSVRYILRRSGEREPIHCEHPPQHIVYGDGYIPDYCEACGWRA